jgi:hypothetical protein
LTHPEYLAKVSKLKKTAPGINETAAIFLHRVIAYLNFLALPRGINSPF